MRKSVSKEQEHIKGARAHQGRKSTSREQRQMMRPKKGARADRMKEKIASKERGSITSEIKWHLRHDGMLMVNSWAGGPTGRQKD
jgi:hypothetical protein